MEIDFSKKGKLIYSQYDCIYERLFSVSKYKDMQGKSPTPASPHLFQNDDEAAVFLPEDQADLFHHYVAQLLFLCKRARPDLQTAVAFLCTRVKAPNKHDWKKLCHVIRYLRGTAHLPLIIGWDQSGNIYWYVDAAFAAHNNMRGHTGAIMTMGHGTIVGISNKQKTNTKSSTEAELVGVDEALPLILCSRMFAEAQGMRIKDNILYQDNMSAIKNKSVLSLSVISPSQIFHAQQVELLLVFLEWSDPWASAWDVRCVTCLYSLHGRFFFTWSSLGNLIYFMLS